MKMQARCRVCNAKAIVEGEIGQRVEVPLEHESGCAFIFALEQGREAAWIREFGLPIELTPAREAPVVAAKIDVSGLEDKWRTDSPDYPPCAICSLPIGSPEADNADPEDSVIGMCSATAIRVVDEKDRELAFHHECLVKYGRIKK